MVKTTVRLREDQVEAARKESRKRGLSFSATPLPGFELSDRIGQLLRVFGVF